MLHRPHDGKPTKRRVSHSYVPRKRKYTRPMFVEKLDVLYAAFRKPHERVASSDTDCACARKLRRCIPIRDD